MTKIKFTDIISFVGATPTCFEGEKHYISTGAVDKFSVNNADVEIVTYANRPSRANLIAQKDDVLFAKMAETVKTLRIDEEMSKNIYSTGFCAVRANEKIITSKCLYYLVSSPVFLAQKDKYAFGATQRAITNSGMTNIFINVPSLSEQENCVKNLDAITLLIAKRKEQLVQLDKLVKSQFIEMFGRGAYPIKKWGEVFETKTGKLDSNAMVENGRYPFFTCSKETLRINTFAFDQEALLLAGNNAAGKYDVKYYKGKFNAYQRTYVLTLKREGVYQLFKCQLENKLDYLQQQSLGGLTKYLTIKILNDLEFIVPPIELQNEFARFVEQIDKSKLKIKRSLEKLETLKKALMQKYFG